VHSDPAEAREHPEGVDPVPAAAGTANDQGVYLRVRAQCTQCSLPSTRSPVSSKPTTSLAASRSRTQSRNSPSRPAARPVTSETVPADSGVPNSSANACAVRFLDRNWPT